MRTRGLAAAAARGLDWAPVGVGLGLWAAFAQRAAFRVDGEAYFSLFDDAMVSMRYARNLVEGGGLAWNPGESPVEGYSNFLWTLWMAALHLAPVSESKVALLVTASGAALLTLDLLLVRAVARRLAPAASAVARVATWSVALSYPLAFWSLRGMEVGLLAALAMLAVLLALRLRDGFGIGALLALAAVLGLGLLARTDFVVPGVIVAGFAALAVPPGRRRLVGLVLGAAILGTLAVHTGFRLLYYGDPLPNTYYLKLTGVDLGTRLVRGWAALVNVGLAGLLAPVVLAAGYFVLRRGAVPAGASLLGMLILGQCTYAVYVGGDAWEWSRHPSRYLATGLPALLLLSALGVHAVTRAGHRTGERAALFGALALGLALVPAAEARVGPWLVEQLVLEANLTPSWTDKLPAAVLVALAGALVVGARRPLASSAAMILLGAAAIVAADYDAWAGWYQVGGLHVHDDAVIARYGLDLRRATDPEASIAAVWAGAIPYFARRPSVDLLGKNDPIIARGAPRIAAFKPGHNKWDHLASIERTRPDLVAQVWQLDETERRAIEARGYVRVAPSVFVRADSRAVDRDAVERAACGLVPGLQLFWGVADPVPDATEWVAGEARCAEARTPRG